MQLLRIAILAQLESQTITEQLAPLLRERGHTVDIIDISTVTAEDFTSTQEIQSLVHYDAVYYRSGLEPGCGSERILQLETFLRKHSVTTVNLHFREHPLAHSKSYEIQQAEQADLKIPKSVYSSEASYETLGEVLELPFVTKTNYGTNGQGVHLIKNAKDFAAIKKLYPNTELLHQSFIPHDFEYRIHIIDGVAVGIWKKIPLKGEFRSNAAQGGDLLTADPKHVAKLTELAKKTYEAFGFNIFVADFMLDKNTDSFYFTEINLNPGWDNTTNEMTKINRSALAADYFEKICA